MKSKKNTKNITTDNSTTVNKIEQKPIGKVVKDDFLDFGDYVANHRHTVSIKDGCKPSYRRLIYSAFANFPNGSGKLFPSTTVISSVANYHGHGLTGIELLNANLVHSGIFEGEGSWGYTQIDGVYNSYAAPRYTHQRVSNTYNEIFKELLPEIPKVESEVGPLECEYLPVCIPIALYIKSSITGLLIGKRNDYPNFSPWSMYRALKENNPYLLEPNGNLLIDKEHSELDKLWNTGKGKVVYSFKLTQTVDDYGNPGILFEGDTFLFTPNFKKLNKLAEEGKVYMEDLTDVDGPKMIVSRVPGARGISINEIEDLCRKCCFSNTTYNLNVTDDYSVYRIPLKDWLQKVYDNFIRLTKLHNQKKIVKVSFDISVLESLPIISDYIVKVNPKATDKEISTNLNIHPDIVKEVLQKPISYIRKNKDNSSRLKSLKNELKELERFDPEKYAEEIIKKL